MDPASASLAFVGFTASLVTLVGLATDSLKTIYRLHERIKNAPEDILRLQRDLGHLQTLLLKIQRRQHENGRGTISQPLCELWNSSCRQMQEDMANFREFVLDLDRRLGHKSISSKNLRVRIHLFFEDDRVVELQRRLSMHTHFLQLVENIMSFEMLSELSVTTKRFADSTELNFERITNNVDGINLSIQEHCDTQQSTLESLEIHLEALLGYLEPISSRFTSNPHQNTRGRQSSKVAIDDTVRPVLHNKTRFSNLFFGKLHISITLENQEDTANASFKSPKRASLRITFVPPRFISNIALQGHFEIQSDLQRSMIISPRITCSLKPISINRNPLFLKVFSDLDVRGMRDLFVMGQAHPTDHISPPGNSTERPLTLLEAFLLGFNNMFSSSFMLSKHKRVVEFILDQGVSASLEFVIFFFYSSTAMWPKDRPVSSELIKGYLQGLSMMEEVTLQTTIVRARMLPSGDFLNFEEQLSLLSTLVNSAMGFDAIPDCLFLYIKTWDFEDFAPIDRWLIAIFAHTNKNFQAALRRYLGSFVSPFTSTGNSTADRIFKSFLRIAMIIDQVKGSDVSSRLHFLRLIITKGSISMLKPFLKAGVNFDESGYFAYSNPLGWAAAKGDLDIVHALLDAGANGALALPRFLNFRHDPLMPEFHGILSLLVDKISPVESSPSRLFCPDPLVSLLKSNDAYKAHPHVVHTLLDNTAYNYGSLHGSKEIYPCNSQVYRAIENDRPDALELFFKRGVESDALIGNIFNCNRDHWQTTKLCTWITFGVEYGRFRCVEVLIKYGASIVTPDESGQNAIQIAQLNISKRHPRKPCHDQEFERNMIFLAQDMETLAVLEKTPLLQVDSASASNGFNPQKGLHKFGTDISSCLKRLTQHLEAFAQYCKSVNLDALQKSAGNALLIFFAYIVSYGVLILFEAIAIISWLTQFPRLPRTFILAVLFILIVVGKYQI